MSAHDMGSWIITITFVVTACYLIFEGRQYRLLNLVSSLATALIMCFCGLLFAGVSSYAMAAVGASLDNEVVLGLLVSVGALLSLLIRHYWNRRKL